MHSLNEHGYGIYFSINSFNKRRTGENLIKLNAVYADIDIAKEGDGTGSEELERRKQAMIEVLKNYCEPSVTIVTKNGIQPLWYIDEDKVDEETIKMYKSVIEGVIEFSIEHGGLGDNVKDVSRILRLPGYFHKKSIPFMIRELNGSGHRWNLLDLKNFFWKDPIIKMNACNGVVKNNCKKKNNDESDPLWKEIDKIDIREIVIRAGAQAGLKIEFGRDNHLILNGERRGTFVSSNRQFINTQSSVFPLEGNRVMVAAKLLGVSNYEAVRWICNSFDNDIRLELYGG